ncbi:MAG: hypothetical protein MUF18_10720 [Fimbriiglobus sp.]|jgi:hypothetical protein|nr:hypothetical protein [Fimbriiglobus sp.]
MRRFLLRGLVAATVVGLPAVALADPPAESPPSRPLLARLNPFATPEPGPRVRKPVGPLSDEMLLGILQAEKDAYTRRLDVCHRLREIALQSNDEKLEVRANELERQATAAYHERVSRLGVKSGGPLPPVAPSAAVVATLDRSLGSGAAVNPLTTAKPTAGGKTASAKATQFKEVAQ